MQQGRERRRNDFYGRTRRYVYGVMLLAVAPVAMAAEELSSVSRFRAPPIAETTTQLVTATLQGLVLLQARESADPSQPALLTPRIGLDTITAHMLDGRGGDLPRFRVAVVETGEIRDGMGFDLNLPDVGNFHLNLFARNNAKTLGKRWNVAGADALPHSWSLGGTMELVRTIDGSRHFAFVPELKLDIDSSGARYLPFQAAVKFAHWRSTGSSRAFDEQVPQVAFKWRL